MTYSNSKTHLCPVSQGSSSQPANAHDTYFAAFAPGFQAAAAIMLTLLSRACAAFNKSLRSGCPRESKRVKLLVMTLAIILTTLKGSRLEKTLFLKKLFAKHNERLDRIYARYLKWRQRKCWMWGGGFMLAALGRFLAGCFAAHDVSSFDALIPN